MKRFRSIPALALLLVGMSLAVPISAAAAHACGSGTNGNSSYTPSIELGCQGKGNPIEDLLFAIIRFLSTGVGLVIIASLIVAGIQYTTSRGDPGATAKAIGRIRSNMVALLVFVFAYAILNYVIPGQLLTPGPSTTPPTSSSSDNSGTTNCVATGQNQAC